VLINAYIKGATAACYGTSVPSSRRTKWKFKRSIAAGKLLFITATD